MSLLHHHALIKGDEEAVQKGYFVDGASAEYLNMPYSAFTDFNSDESFSWEFMLYWSSLDGGNTSIMTKIGPAAAFKGYVFIFSNDIPRFILRSNNGTNDRLIAQYTSGLTDNTWNHMVFTYDGSKDISGCKIYINNVSVLVDSAVNNLTGAITLNAPIFLLEHITAANFKLDHVRLFNS